MEQRMTKVEEELSNCKADIVDLKTRVAVAESNIKDIKEDLSSIKNNTTWIIRILLGLIITGVWSFIIKGGI